VSTSDLRQLIRELNRLDVVRADYNYLVQKLRAASKDTSIPLFQSSSTEFFFRARICNSCELDHVSQLGAPPAEKVVGYQRCNPPGVPMFYAASNRQTALIEIDAQDEDIVFLSQWMPKAPLPINQVFTSSFPVERPEASAREILFHSYLDTIFTRQIHDSFSDAYKLTAAAAEVLTTRFVESTIWDVRVDGTVGLRYPSVAHTFQAFNTAFHADFAKERLELVHVTKLKVVKRSPGHTQILLLDTALEAVDGFLVWQRSPIHIPLPIEDRKRIPFISNGRAWTLPVFQHPPSESDIDRFLSE